MLGIDLTSNSGKSQIRTFFRKAFTCLKESDRNLPQVVKVESLLARGFAVHHAGLLLIVKEAVEMLFCRGLIKVLFSTEMFVMGVNALARTIIPRSSEGEARTDVLVDTYLPDLSTDEKNYLIKHRSKILVFYIIFDAFRRFWFKCWWLRDNDDGS